MSEIKNRSELVFLYDIKDANPNGDPLDENKPRIDEETGINLVTDVRFKRTIRDYLHDFKNEEIFVRGVRNDNGQLKTKEDRLTDLVSYKIFSCFFGTKITPLFESLTLE